MGAIIEIRHTMTIFNQAVTDGDTAEVETATKCGHPVRTVAREVGEPAGVDLEGFLQHPEDPSMGITPPKWSDPVMAVIDSGALPFTMEGLDERASDDDEAHAGVTAIHVLRNHVVRETVTELVESGQFEAAVTLFDGMVTDDDPDPRTVAAYAVFRYAKGWLAEQLVTSHDQFSKLGIDNDEAGYDLRYYAPGADRQTEGEDGQLKPVTAVGSNSQSHFEEMNIPHWMYQWTREGIKWARAERANKMNREAAKEDGLRSATAIKKSCKSGEVDNVGRRARLLWW